MSGQAVDKDAVPERRRVLPAAPLGKLWERLSLETRFNLASLLILLMSLFVLGWWVGRTIEAGVVQRTAAATSLFVENFIVTELQELGDRAQLSEQHVARLEWLLDATPLGREIVAIKIWAPGGRIVYGAGAGSTYDVKGEQARAWAGGVVAHVSNLSDDENAPQGEQFDRLLETYTPIRLEGNEKVIAVAEFYSRVDALEREIRLAQGRSWLVVSGVVTVIYLLLVGLVRQGGRTIRRQASELRAQVAERDGLLSQNRALHGRVARAAERTTALNERFLRRVSADLHDGPAQDLSFALLKLDGLARLPQTEAERAQQGAQVQALQGSLERATRELRAVARGLRLPELEPLTLYEALRRAVHDFERRSGAIVLLEFTDLPESVPLSLKITVFRIVQEALSNAYRHGGGAAYTVAATADDTFLTLTIGDDGRGFTPSSNPPTAPSGLGLVGMRERAESLGGLFAVTSAPGEGTRVVVRLPLGEGLRNPDSKNDEGDTT